MDRLHQRRAVRVRRQRDGAARKPSRLQGQRPVSARRIRSAEETQGLAPASRTHNLLDWLFQLRDVQREQRSKGAWLIKGKDVPWEHNRQGRMKWFMHPALQDTCIRSMLFYEQEIPPGGRSGLQMTPGGHCIFILQ